MMLVKIALGIALCVIILIVAVRVGVRIADNQPASTGTERGQLNPCPGTPNCVSSSSSTDSEYVEAIAYSGSRQQAHTDLLTTLASMPGSIVKSQTSHYVHAEFKSRLFGFVDDVEFLFDGNTPKIHVRSASRMGHSDLGVNRKRVESIRNQFQSIHSDNSQ